jgi:hypothetical protein
MNLNDVEQLAKELIAKHIPSYTFVWDRNPRLSNRVGQCRSAKNEISLTASWIEEMADLAANRKEVYITILHEIAHGLVAIRYAGRNPLVQPKQAHGPQWRAEMRRLGLVRVRKA